MTRAALLLMLCSPLVALAAPPGGAAAPTGDRDFVLAAIQAGQQEVHDSAWAAKSSHMEPVRQIAAMLWQDHSASTATLSALARHKGVGVPATTASTNPTPSFSDAEFVAGQIQAHEDAIALFTTEANQGTDKDFRAYAKQALPVLRSHLKALRALQSR